MKQSRDLEPEADAARSTIAPRDVLLADIGGSHIRLARHRPGDDCELLATVPTPTKDWGQFCAALSGAVRVFAKPSAALSISIAGVVSPQTGQLVAANIPCLNTRSLAKELAALLGMPVVVTNDADCAALAEARVGAGVGHGVVFCAVLGTGVGGGLVVDGRLVRGAGGLTGEWGHGPIVNEAMVRSGDGRSVRVPRFRCGCGMSGCADTVGGARGLERLHAFLSQTDLSSHQILDDWMAGEPMALATVAAYIELISGPLALVVNVTGASVVPVCGGLSRCSDLVSALDVAVRRQILRNSDRALVVPSLLNDRAGLIGAAYAYA
ncbi:ROK family protein [Roseateles oligotrophus]|uniref:ROK family protein n=1 Tax=Roseateles oligotrophus TaxID=1769250 RepID=A0ABT2YK95_9BURK|nr:ROK family protein [Roseateles oligotrophus]MCV2370474.1 ROK family protein [Roseateles oligotrophus]